MQRRNSEITKQITKLLHEETRLFPFNTLVTNFDNAYVVHVFTFISVKLLSWVNF